MSAANLPVRELLRKTELWATESIPFLPATGAADQLAGYIEMLLAWNRSLNLSAHNNAKDLLRDLIQDSFFLAVFLESLLYLQTAPQILDIGAGAGLPGLPLRIFWQHGSYVMIESRQKRALFLANVLAKLKLPATSAICARAEQYFNLHEPADCIVSRAFMPWSKLLDFCKPGLAQNGIIIVMANEPPPILNPVHEEFWKVKASLEYFPHTKSRWLWALTAKD